MKFVLSKSDFEFLKKNIYYAFEMITNIKSENDNIFFDVDNVREFQSEITDAVVVSGMDDEDTVNEKSKRMYRIYDEILYQKRKCNESL